MERRVSKYGRCLVLIPQAKPCYSFPFAYWKHICSYHSTSHFSTRDQDSSTDLFIISMSGAETSSGGELIELVLRSGSAPIPGQPAASSSNEVPDTTSTPRRKKTTKGPLTGCGGSSGGTKTRSQGGRRGGGGRTLSRLNTPIKRSGTEDGTSDADECPQPKKPKPNKLPPYIIGIDLGMWGFGVYCSMLVDHD